MLLQVSNGIWQHKIVLCIEKNYIPTEFGSPELELGDKATTFVVNFALPGGSVDFVVDIMLMLCLNPFDRTLLVRNQ